MPDVVHAEVHFEPVCGQLPLARHHARVCNEYVEPTEGRSERRREGTDRLKRSEVELHHVQVLRAGLLGDLTLRRLPSLGVATGDHDGCASLRKSGDGCLAYAAVATRHDADPTLHDALRTAASGGGCASAEAVRQPTIAGAS